MKSCKNCLHYEICDSDTKESCEVFRNALDNEPCKYFIDHHLVKCKDCKYYDEDVELIGSACKRLFTIFPMNPDDFCSYAEEE